MFLWNLFLNDSQLCINSTFFHQGFPLNLALRLLCSKKLTRHQRIRLRDGKDKKKQTTPETDKKVKNCGGVHNKHIIISKTIANMTKVRSPDMKFSHILLQILTTSSLLSFCSQSDPTISSSNLRIVNVNSRYDPFSNIPLQRLFRRNSAREGDDEQLTTVTGISTELNYIEIHFNFIISSTRSPQEVQWLIRVREFGQNSKKLTRVIATTEPPEIKDYSIRVDDLTPSTAYETCVHTLNHTITKKPHVMQDIKGCHYALDMMCFEVITKSEKTNVAVASVISSASTFVIVVLCFCCFIPRKTKKDEKNVEGKRTYFQITNLISSDPSRDQQVETHEIDDTPEVTPPHTPSTSSSATLKGAQYVNQSGIHTEAKEAVTDAIFNKNPDLIDYYIDPKDISLVHDKSNVKIFSK
jgi:hypothetical protein